MTDQKGNQSIDMNELAEIMQSYIEKFGKEPVVIGMFWQDPDRLNQNLLDAVMTGKEYNEYELLSDEDKKDFDDGNLLF